MIALPIWCKCVRIATPEAAVTATGVSPISSSRNVMVANHHSRKVFTCKCGFSGISEDFQRPKKILCKPCHKEYLRTKNTHKCKGCDALVKVSLKKHYCSDACRIAYQAKDREARTVIASCCVCGAEVVREYKRERYCCSDRCQKTWAAKCQHIAASSRIDWIERSKKAKEQYRKKSQSIRRKSNEWWTLCNRKITSIQEVDDWESKCNKAASMLKKRLLIGGEKIKSKPKTFEELCQIGVSGSGYSKLDEWSKKCYSTAKNLKWKRRLRNVKGCMLLRIETPEAQLKQRTLWEFLSKQHGSN